MPLWAVIGDEDSAGGGALTGDADSSPHTVKINNIPVIVHLSNASPDSNCPASPHCNPHTDAHSPTVFAYGKPAVRHDDARVCGDTTVVSHQSTVFVES